ncbi:MAG: hypothetical protein ACR2KV_17225 [Solirubrobacteraceae bacterium]
MVPTPPPERTPEDPLAGVGREPLHEAIASAREERRGGISARTLGVAAAASGVASYTVSHVWGSGTVLSAALTPVLVALVSEFLHRPVDAVARVAPIHPRTTAGPPKGELRPPRPADPPTGTEADWAPVSYGETAPPAWRPRWRLILLTGLAAFAIVVGIFTIPELVVGHSLTGAGGSTTYFSGPSPSTPAVHPPPQTAPRTTTTDTTTTTPTDTTTTTTPSTTTETTTTQTNTTATTAPANPAPTSAPTTPTH